MQDAQLTKGERLKKLRLLLGYNQTEFGNELSRAGVVVAQNYISKIEKGERNIGSDVQTRIEARFNVRSQWINDGIGEVFVNGEAPTLAPMTEQRQDQIRRALGTLPSRIAKQNSSTWVTVRDRGQFLRNPDQALLRRTGFPMFSDRTFAFEVADSSMMPRFAGGSYLICTETTSEDMVKGLPYVVATDAQLLIALYAGKYDDQLRFEYLNDTRKDQAEERAVHGVYHIELMLVKP